MVGVPKLSPTGHGAHRLNPEPFPTSGRPEEVFRFGRCPHKPTYRSSKIPSPTSNGASTGTDVNATVSGPIKNERTRNPPQTATESTPRDY